MSRFDVVCVFLLKRMQHNHDPGKPGGEHNPLGALCITLAELWYADRDGLQGAFLQPIARHG